MKRTESQMTYETKQKKKLKTEESNTLENDDSKEKELRYFDWLPIDMEITIFSFVISKMDENWEKNWNNISLVSKHWNSIAWISFQRFISKRKKETIFIRACDKHNFFFLIQGYQKGMFHFINKLLAHDTTFDPSFQDNIAIRIARENGFVDIVNLLLKDKRVDPSDDNNFAIGVSYCIRNFPSHKKTLPNVNPIQN